ncbi:MAG: type VI secretion system tube protein Hcp [Akkermansiaceae bacterium]
MLLSKNGTPVQTDASHSWVKLSGFSQSTEKDVVIGPGGGAGGANQAKGKPVTLQMESDGCIAEMIKAVATGETYTIRFQLARPGTVSYSSVMTELTFNQVAFSKVASSASTGGQVSFDVTFHYGEMIVAHTVLDQAGNPELASSGGWDFVGNQSILGTATIPSLGDYGGGAPPTNDTDNDRMPNNWETAYGLNPESAADATGDPDGDGFTNLQEYIAGTHPKQGNSFFRVSTTLTTSTPQPKVKLIWSGVAGRTYKVEASTNLTSGFSVIHTISPTATGELNYEPAAGAGPYFRLSVEE